MNEDDDANVDLIVAVAFGTIVMFIAILAVVNFCMKGKVKKQGGIYSAKSKADKSDGQILVHNSTFKSEIATPTPKGEDQDENNTLVKEGSEESKSVDR